MEIIWPENFITIFRSNYFRLKIFFKYMLMYLTFSNLNSIHWIIKKDISLYVLFRSIFRTLGSDHLTWKGGLWFFVSFKKKISVNTRVSLNKNCRTKREFFFQNNNQSLNVQNTCCKSTILLPDSISANLNLWTIADHLVY